eukprot:1520688-Pleurochrysis_carterae.AAC.2
MCNVIDMYEVVKRASIRSQKSFLPHGAGFKMTADTFELRSREGLATVPESHSERLVAQASLCRRIAGAGMLKLRQEYSARADTCMSAFVRLMEPEVATMSNFAKNGWLRRHRCLHCSLPFLCWELPLICATTRTDRSTRAFQLLMLEMSKKVAASF